jgi:hypothetical protein
VVVEAGAGALDEGFELLDPQATMVNAAPMTATSVMRFTGGSVAMQRSPNNWT